MRLRTIIFLGFFAIILLATLLVGVNFYIGNQRLALTNQIKDVEAPLELMAEQVIGYDAMLTENVHEALLHSQKGKLEEAEDNKHVYDQLGLKLDNLLKNEAIGLLEKSKRPQEIKDNVTIILKKLDEVNIELVDLETQAFAAIENGNIDLAYYFVVGEEYKSNKKELARLYNNWGDIEKKVTNDMRNHIISYSGTLNQINLYSTILIIISSIVLSFLIASSISKPIKRLENELQEVSRGKLNVPLEKSRLVEIQGLTDSFSRLLATIKLAILRTGVTKEELGIADIKAKKIAERELKDSEMRYRNLFDNAVDAIFIADSVTRQIIDCNKAAEKLMGYSKEKLLSMKADELHPKDLVKETMEKFKQQVEGKIKAVSSEVLTKDKKRIPISINAAGIKIGDKTCVQGIFRDITTEEEFNRLKERKALLRESRINTRENLAEKRENIVSDREKKVTERERKTKK